jgi:hypothetical protein
MSAAGFQLEPLTNELRKDGQVVAITDRPYSISSPSVVFDDLIVKGDLAGNLQYNGHTLQIVSVGEIIGLELTLSGARGPVWKNVVCRVVA